MRSTNISSTINSGKSASHLAIFLLFPGFFFYQTLLGIGAIPAFLGGYFSIVSLALILPLVFFYLTNVKRDKNYFSKLDLYFFALLIYIFFVIAINFIAGANTKIVEGYAPDIVNIINIFIIFKMSDFNEKKFRMIWILSLIAMSAITFYFSIDGFFYLQSLNESKNPESLATYQGFARSYIYTFVIIISSVWSTKARILLYSLAIPTLFVNGARSEFTAIIFLIPIVEIYYAKYKLYSVFAILSALVIIGLNFEYILNILPDNRILQLLDLSHSSSAILRYSLTDQAWQTIYDNPILGDFASYPYGDYAHNILSAWVDFGLFGFIYLSTILILPALLLFSDGFLLKTKSSDFLLALSFTCITLLWALTAKNSFDMSIGAALGAFAKYRYGRKYD